MTIEFSPRVPDSDRPRDYADLSAEQADLNDAINELMLRLEDHKYRWELYGYGLIDVVERERVQAIIDHLRTALNKGGPAVLNPLRDALFAAHPHGLGQ